MPNPPEAAPPLSVAIYSANSYTSGDGSLSNAVIEAAGLQSIADRLGAQGWPGALSITISGSGDARVLTADVPTSWGSRWPLR